MIRQHWKYISVLVAVSVLFIYVEASKPVPTDWRATFNPKTKAPFGLYVLDQMWQKAFPTQKVIHTTQSVYETLEDLNENDVTATNFVMIHPTIGWDDFTTEEILRFAARGNQVFLSTHELPESLSDTLKVEISEYWGAKWAEVLDPNAQEKQDSVQVTLSDEHVLGTNKYLFPVYFANQDILVKDAKLRTDSTRFEKLGKSKMWTNFVRIRFGKGIFYIHALPFAFTNYEMLEAKNAEYAFKSLSYLPIQKTYVESYLRGMTEDTSLLRYVLRQEGLRWAYFVLLLSSILFIFTFTKRRQRIIPTQKPLENTSLSFIQTVGRLYFHQNDHHHLATKKIEYFLERIRHRYQLSTLVFDDDFCAQLARKTRLPQKEVLEVFQLIVQVQQQKTISEKDLRQLNEMLQKFD